MPVETAADLAGMFSVDEFAEGALYTGPAGGGSLACTVVVDRGQGRSVFTAGHAESATSERMLFAQRAELAEVQRDGTFAMLDVDGVATGELFRIAGTPKLDQLGTLWSCELLIED